MKESKNHVPTMYESNPAVAALNKVPGFDPLKFLRRVISPETKEEVLRLDLPYKKLWFRLAHPKGRIRVNALRVTEQLAIYEAQVYLDLNDGVPVASFTSQYTKEDAPGGRYIQAAQHEAINEALSDAGFGLQFADVEMTEERMRFGSEISPLGNPAPKSPSSISQTPAAPPKEAAKIAPKEIKSPVPTAQATRNRLPVMPTQKETLSAAPKVQEEALPVAPERQEEPLPVMATPQADTLPVLPATSEDALPIPPATQQTVPAKEPLSEAESAAHILYMDSAAKKDPAAVTEPEVKEPTAEPNPPKYTPDMPVEEIVKLMTYEEAKQVVVDEGACKGWTIEEVAKRRRPSLKFYLYGGYNGSNILKAASKIMLDALPEQKAG